MKKNIHHNYILRSRNMILNNFTFIFVYLSLCIGFVGLAVDHFSERIYWADLELSVIGSVLYDGSDSVVSVSSKQGLWSAFVLSLIIIEYIKYWYVNINMKGLRSEFPQFLFLYKLLLLLWIKTFIPGRRTKRPGQKNLA